MSGRLDRAKRAARIAKQAEDSAQAIAAQSSRRVRETTDAIGELVTGSHELAMVEMPPGLRGLLVDVGARKLSDLDHERGEHSAVADVDRAAWDEARVHARSMDKMVERIELTERRAERRADAAELQDMISSRLVAEHQAERVEFARSERRS